MANRLGWMLDALSFSKGPFANCNKSRSSLVMFHIFTCFLLQSGHQPAVLIWDLTTLSLSSELKGHQYGVACMALSSDG